MSHDDAFLELDAPPSSDEAALCDPTPGLPVVPDDDAFLEVTDGDGARTGRGRVVSDDDLRMVTALADDEVPLLAALWPSTHDLYASLPTLPALMERVALARTTLNQVTRRGAEWRARAEVAGAALTRRLDALRRRIASGATAIDARLLAAACEDLRAWHERALEDRLRAEAGSAGKVYSDGVRRLFEDARRRGFEEDSARALAKRVGVELLQAEVAPWTPCTVLPGAPRTLDAVADALVGAQSQGVAALRDGSLVVWLRANRASDELVAAAQEAHSIAGEQTPGAASVGLWTLAWALGREGVVVEGHTVTGPETLLAHLRAARLHESQVVGAAPALVAWFRRKGHHGAAAACEALARGDAHAGLRLRWALGEPLRLGDRAVTDPATLAREVLARQATRAAALDAWRSGTLLAWLDTLPRAKRDALWHEDLSRAASHDHDEGAFWRGVYRRVPRAALRVYLGDGVEGRAVRFETVADLRVTSRVAAVWEPLKRCLRSGELGAWLSVAAPGVELAPRGDDEDVALFEVLAALGHTGLVLPWGRAGFAVSSPSDLVAAWKRAWQQVEALLPRGFMTAWLRRHHPTLGVMGVTVEQCLDAWGPALGAGTLSAGVASLRLALLCGLDELPLEPQRPMVRGVVRGYRKLDAYGRDPTAWEPLWSASSPHRTSGTLLLWMARHAPPFGVLAAGALTDPSSVEACFEALVASGVPVATDALATEHVVAEREAARRAAEREAAALAAAREAAALAARREEARLAEEREEAKLIGERERVRREVEREVARLTAERDAAREAVEREVARLTAERELARVEAEREVARLTAERDAARVEAERAVVRAATERDAARLDAERLAAKAAAERDEARLEAERARLERDIAKLERDQTLRRAQYAKDAEAQSAAEREAARLQEIDEARRAAALEAERLRSLEEQARQVAERESARVEALEAEAKRDAERRSGELAALAEEARRVANEEAARLAALEEECRRETARRAEEAALAASRLAEEARRRELAELEAEELARRLLSEREVAREAAWAARKVAAEREIARLAEAERRARALAAELTREESADDTPTVEALETLVEIEGALDDDAAPDATLSPDEPAVLPERRELRPELLIEAQPVDDEQTRARVRAAISRWAHRQSGLASTEPSAGVDLRELTARPAFEAQVTTRMESRALTFVGPPWRDDDAIAVPPEATAPGASVDPWALALPEVDAWTTWRAEFLLDTPPIRGLCRACEHGRVPCSECRGGGDRTCPTCAGRVRLRCGRCAGAGEVAGAKGIERCPVCNGRREEPCGACEYGRVACARCHGKKTVSCGGCRGLGQLVERVAVVQSYEGVAAASLVRSALPAAIAAAVQTRETDPLPVVHIEAAEIDPYALARELPHAALAEAAALLLADEAARAREGQRVTRQRLVVRRYAAFEARCEIDGEPYSLWVHGPRDAVYAEASPRSRKIEALLSRARAALAGDALSDAIEMLAALQAMEEDNAEARALSESLGDAVLATARRGELFEARELSSHARALRWPGCVAKLVEVERILGERLQVRAPWALIEDARVAFERGRDERCAERLTQLAALEPDNPEGRRLSRSLGERIASQSVALVARGDLDAAEALIAKGRAVPFDACGAAMRDVVTLLASARRRQRRTAWLPWVVALLATAVALVALLSR